MVENQDGNRASVGNCDIQDRSIFLRPGDKNGLLVGEIIKFCNLCVLNKVKREVPVRFKSQSNTNGKNEVSCLIEGVNGQKGCDHLVETVVR